MTLASLRIKQHTRFAFTCGNAKNIIFITNWIGVLASGDTVEV